MPFNVMYVPVCMYACRSAHVCICYLSFFTSLATGSKFQSCKDSASLWGGGGVGWVLKEVKKNKSILVSPNNCKFTYNAPCLAGSCSRSLNKPSLQR